MTRNLDTPLEISLSVGESARARYMDVILDMDELTAIGLSVSGTLTGLSYPARSWSWEMLHMHMVGCVCA